MVKEITWSPEGFPLQGNPSSELQGAVHAEAAWVFAFQAKTFALLRNVPFAPQASVLGEAAKTPAFWRGFF